MNVYLCALLKVVGYILGILGSLVIVIMLISWPYPFFLEETAHMIVLIEIGIFVTLVLAGLYYVMLQDCKKKKEEVT